MALDVLRALAKSREALEAVFAEGRRGAGGDPRPRRFVTATRAELFRPRRDRAAGRRVVERMALCPAGLAARALRAAGRWLTPSARPGWPATRACITARCPPASTPAAIVARHTPPV
jgi:putative acyl-CoA dehydrogenase